MLLPGASVPYITIRSSRARSIKLRIVPDGYLEIVVPKRASLPDVHTLVRLNARWITDHLERLEAADGAVPGFVKYLGEDYEVVVSNRDARRSTVTMIGRTLSVELRAGSAVAPVVERFLIDRAGEMLAARAELWSKAIGIDYLRLSVRDQRTRWGSCSSTGNLNFNWRLVMAPVAVLDYVVVHELMHRREMNHSPSFWKGVEEQCPDYRLHRSWLKQNGLLLARPLKALDSNCA